MHEILNICDASSIDLEWNEWVMLLSIVANDNNECMCLQLVDWIIARQEEV